MQSFRTGFPRPIPDLPAGVRIKSIQTGSSTFSGGAGLTLDVAISSVNRDKSIAIVTYRANSGTADLRYAVIAHLTTDTNLRLERAVDAGQTSFVEWAVIEFDGPVMVQYGTTSWTSGTAIDVTITAVDAEKAFVLMTWTPNVSNSGRIPTAHLTSATNLRFTRLYSGSGGTEIAWFVVEIG